MSGFARAVTWRLAAIEARPPRPGDTALLVALAEEARCSLAPYVPAETLRAVEARCRAAAGRGTLVQLELWSDERRAAA